MFKKLTKVCFDVELDGSLTGTGKILQIIIIMIVIMIVIMIMIVWLWLCDYDCMIMIVWLWMQMWVCTYFDWLIFIAVRMQKLFGRNLKNWDLKRNFSSFLFCHSIFSLLFDDYFIIIWWLFHYYLMIISLYICYFFIVLLFLF